MEILIARKTKNKKPRVVGRGGRHAKTSGRGTKGQNARSGHRKRPELRDIIKKLPKLRGRGKNTFKSHQIKPVSVSLASLSVFTANDTVNPMALFEKGLIKKSGGKVPAVKILGNGTLDKAVVISGCTVSATAKSAIEKAGGKIEA